MNELIPTEIELAGLAERVRCVKTALREAVRVMADSEQAFREAQRNVYDLRQQLSAARGTLIEAADGSDEDGLTW